MNLNLGCGEYAARHRLPGWEDVDSYGGEGTDPSVVADIKDLPFPDGSAARVYCGHVLEHLTKDDCLLVLAEVRRVLAPGGELMVVGPDADRARVGWPEMMEQIVGGEGRWPGDVHMWVPTEADTAGLLEVAGFRVTPVPVANVNPRTWPIVSHIGWQFALLAEAIPREAR